MIDDWDLICHFYFRQLNSEEAEDLESKVVVPKHVDHMLPLSESMLSSSNVGLIGDFALFMSRKFRIGWAPYWSLANPGDSFVMSKVKEAATDVFIERHESLPGKIYFYISCVFSMTRTRILQILVDH